MDLSDDDQDEILHSFPVYINNPIHEDQETGAQLESLPGTETPHAGQQTTSLCVLQFPLGFGVALPEEAKVKSIQGILNKNSSAAAAKKEFGRAKKMLEMDVNLTGMPKKESGMLEVGQDINQQIPMESFSVPKNARYMVGSFHKGVLHLSPVDVIQMRPKLSFIDKRIEKERVGKARQGYDDNKELNPDYEAEAKTVHVSYRAPDDKEGMKKASLAEIQRMIEHEPWTNLKVHPPSSKTSKTYWKKLHCKVDGSIQPESRLIQQAEEYLDTISSFNTSLHPLGSAQTTRSISQKTPTPISAHSTQSSIAESIFSNHSTAQTGRLPAFYESIKLGLPLHDRVASLLLSSHAVSFTQLVQLFTTLDVEEPHDARFLTAELSPLLSILGEISVCVDGVFYINSSMLYKGHAMHARNVLLANLMERKMVSRAEWTSETRMNTTMSGNMLKEICAFDEFERKWVGKVEPDELLSLWFPSIQQKHNRAIATQCHASLAALLNDSSSLKSASATGTLGASAGGPSVASSSPSVTLPIPLSPVKNAKDQHAPTAMLVHLEIEGNDHDDQARNLVLKIVKDNGALLKSHVHEIFRYQASQAEAVKTMVDSISASTLESILTTNTFEIRDDIVAYPPDKTTTLGKYKHSTFTYFKSHDKVKKSEMMDVWQSECDGKPSAGMYAKIMNEVAVTKSSGIWRLKWLNADD